MNLKITDKKMFQMYIDKSPLFDGYLGSELNFQNLLTWKVTDNIEYAIIGNSTLIIRGYNRGISYFFPPISPTTEEFIYAIKTMEKFSVDQNTPFLIKGLTEKMSSIVSDSGIKYRMSEERDYAEYLYSSESLRTLSGKRYNKKRNLLNQFTNKYHYEIKAYEPQDLAMVIDLLERWENKKSHAFEHSAIYGALLNLEPLGCFADLILIDGIAVAFSVGTKNKSMGIVLFEKADTNFIGVYATMNYLFANRHFHDVDIINRQEDLGIAELRKAKMAYYPIDFVKKYYLTRNHLTMDEVNDLKSLYHEAFNDSEGYLNYFFNQKYRADNVIFINENKKIVSALHFVKKNLICFETTYSLPFVVAAATKLTHRNKGLMTQVLKQSIHELYNRKTSLCALSPFNEEFYQTYGFESVLWINQELKPMIPQGVYTYSEVTLDTLEKISDIYHKKMINQNIHIERKISDWENFFHEVEADEGKIILIEENDQSIGYYTLFDDGFEEICLLNEDFIPDRPEFSSRKLELINQTGGKSHLMLRIINVKLFLERYPFSDTVTIDKRIHIVDSFFEANDVTIELVINQGIVSIRDIEIYDEEVTINELTRMIFIEGVYPFSKPSMLIFDRF